MCKSCYAAQGASVWDQAWPGAAVGATITGVAQDAKPLELGFLVDSFNQPSLSAKSWEMLSQMCDLKPELLLTVTQRKGPVTSEKLPEETKAAELMTKHLFP